jgi:hypothetical protein
MSKVPQPQRRKLCAQGYDMWRHMNTLRTTKESHRLNPQGRTNFKGVQIPCLKGLQLKDEIHQ